MHTRQLPRPDPRSAAARLRSAAFARFSRPLACILLLGPPALTFAPGRLAAIDVKPFGAEGPRIDFHGFASQGYLKSSDYNYLGNSSKGSTDFNEFGLNASFNPFSRTRVAAQAFSYDVGPAGENDLVLDYGFVEYTFNDRIAFRVGRLRRPEGLYNDNQDVDVARTWVLPPQGLYNARWRDFYVSIDGAELFGSQSLGRAGSLGYEFYSGAQHPKLDGGLALQRSNAPPFQRLVSINSPRLTGGQLWWSTPLSGFRAGLALNLDQDLTYRTLTGSQSTGSPWTQHYSLEYVRGSWAFQAEYLRYKIDYLITGAGPAPFHKLIEPDTWFVSGAYRFNPWLEAGAYYSEYWADVNDRQGKLQAFPSDAAQKDTTLSLRFDASDHWTFKVENHFIRGTGQLFDSIQNSVRRGGEWHMIAVKSTFSF
jgi:hypothetical protein